MIEIQIALPKYDRRTKNYAIFRLIRSNNNGRLYWLLDKLTYENNILPILPASALEGRELTAVFDYKDGDLEKLQ